MKILQVLPELNSGGVERGTLEMAKYLVSQGHDSLVLSNGGRLVEKLEREGSTHLRLAVHKKSPFSLRQIPVIKRLLRDHRPDIIHLRSRLPGWLCHLAWKQMPTRERPHYVTTVHGLHSVGFYSSIITRGERVICVSKAVKDHLTRHYPDTDPRKLRVIHRGIDPDHYPAGYHPSNDWLRTWYEKFPETKGKKLLTLPGRITRLKGHRDFLEILSQLPDDCHGLIVGGAHPKKRAYLQEMRDLTKRKNLTDRVTFTGERSDLREILALSNLAFSLSGTPESFGRTTLEALALGTPVIGYDHGGVGEILKVCFPAGATPKGQIENAASLASQILLSSPTIDAPGPFLLENMLSQTIALYRELLQPES